MKKSKKITISVACAFLAFVTVFASVFFTQYRKWVLSKEIIEYGDSNYSLSFCDNFNASSLAWYNWQRCPQTTRQDVGGKWNNKYSYTKDGNLIIKCGAENGNLFSGAVRSKYSFSQKYGIYDIRFKVDKADGLWYAFWLMTDSELKVGNGAKDGAEIDVFEIVPNKNIFQTAVHWDGYGEAHKSNQHSTTISNDFYDEWHTVRFVWTETAYVVYLDGTKTFETDGVSFGGICDVPVYLKVTAEYGSWGGNVSESQLPAYMYVDYVKVYKKT